MRLCLRHIALFAFLIQMCILINAQTPEEIDNLFRDSLLHELNTKKLTDEERVINFFLVGVTYNKRGLTDTARFYFEKALEILGGKEFQGGRVFVNIANSYASEGEQAEALKYYLEALKVAESIKGRFRYTNKTRAMANLSECYYMIGNHSQALYYAEEALENEKRVEGRSAGYILPQIYYTIGSVYLDKGMLEEAEKNILKSYEIADSLYQIQKNSGGIVIYCSYGMEGLAKISLARKDYANALEYIGKAITFAEEDGNTTVLTKIWSTLSDIYLEQEEYASSKEAALKAMEFNPKAMELHPEIAFNIATAELFAGNREQAYHYFRTHTGQTKEKTDKNFRETMTGMEIQYETDKKETRIASLEKQKMLYVSLGIVAILLIITLLVVFWLRMQKERQAKQLIATQAIMEGEGKERERLAGSLHDGVIGMLSAVKHGFTGTISPQEVQEKFDDCIEEVRRIAHDMMPVVLDRYGIRIALESHCRSLPNVRFHFYGEDKRIDGQMERAIYYCACELVNNSLRHSGATAINMQLIQDDEYVSLTVQDNGCGFDKEAAAAGIGLQNIKVRVAAFKGTIDLVSSPGKGTETNIDLKIKNKNIWK